MNFRRSSAFLCPAIRSPRQKCVKASAVPNHFRSCHNLKISNSKRGCERGWLPVGVVACSYNELRTSSVSPYSKRFEGNAIRCGSAFLGHARGVDSDIFRPLGPNFLQFLSKLRTGANPTCTLSVVNFLELKPEQSRRSISRSLSFVQGYLHVPWPSLPAARPGRKLSENRKYESRRTAGSQHSTSAQSFADANVEVGANLTPVISPSYSKRRLGLSDVTLSLQRAQVHPLSIYLFLSGSVVAQWSVILPPYFLLFVSISPRTTILALGFHGDFWSFSQISTLARN
ncbi:hypothetical protein SCHPADRAFT_655381 [Schizopora paradoxa]|uniref:Uncharacterized protein n=1 Tax=Schizopora paradoxa TaxID=27342 RepID=A0A0H2R7G9_9AGAM|nr:hypothetical protein SCHPADRAFT_655381 [Schizopora paradoxa]